MTEVRPTTEYILMNKNVPVLTFGYDSEDHRITSILEVHDPAYAPPGILGPQGEPTKAALKQWWRNRAIPLTRDGVRGLLDEVGIDDPVQLLELNHGLSLSDRYWIREPGESASWADLNYFDNAFDEELGLLTLGSSAPGIAAFASSPLELANNPSASLGGDLRKKWTCQAGRLVLVKAGTPVLAQEVYNEVVATALHRRLLDTADYVPYRLVDEGGQPHCACENMLGPDEELVTAFDIMASRKKPNSLNAYQHLARVFEELGVPKVREGLSKMIVSDHLIANLDRHYRNFGAIRNVETLEYVRMAPLFDSGTSLWCRTTSLSSPVDYEYRAKPFFYGAKPSRSTDRQLECCEDLGWFDPAALDGFVEEAMGILALNENLTEKRLAAIREGLERTMRTVRAFSARRMAGLGR